MKTHAEKLLEFVTKVNIMKVGIKWKYHDEKLLEFVMKVSKMK